MCVIIIAMGDNAINAATLCSGSSGMHYDNGLLQRDNNVMPPNTMLIANYICIITFILSLYGI